MNAQVTFSPGAFFRLGIAVLLATAAAGSAFASESVKFMGVDVEPINGRFMATKGVNIRAAPQTDGKSLDNLSEGDLVMAVGRHQGWLAVRRGGKDLGFVFADIMTPAIDGTLEEDIRGLAKSGDGIECDYNIHFEGKSEIEGASFLTSDYEVWFRCHMDGRKPTFPTAMFLTEAPYDGSKGSDFQISLDVPEVGGDEYEAVLTTTMLYNPETGTVRFDSFSLDKLATPPKEKEHKADSIQEVLAAAVEITLATWNRKTLSVLTRKR